MDKEETKKRQRRDKISEQNQGCIGREGQAQ